MLFGGVGKTTHEMTKLRGDVNICIVGEYFTAFESYLVVHPFKTSAFFRGGLKSWKFADILNEDID